MNRHCGENDMFRHIKRACLAAAAVAGAALAILGCETFPPLARFQTPPYLSVTDGLRPESDAVPAKLAAFAPGVKVAWFATVSGQPRILFCDMPLTALAQVPQETAPLALASAADGLGTARAQGSIESVHVASSVAIAGAETGIARAARTGEVASARGGLAINAAQETAGMPVMKGETAAAPTERSVDGFTGLVDLAIVRAIFGSEAVSTFYDQDNNVFVLDESYVITLDEREQIMKLVEEGGSLTLLLNRPASDHFRREKVPPPDAVYAGQLQLTFVPDRLYYGHEVGLAITLKNTGAAPIYDAVICNGVPQNTGFVRFWVEGEATRGFFAYYSKTRRLIFVKVYRPIQPGESFRILAILRADPWTLERP
jgi:hypothetical protein